MTWFKIDDQFPFHAKALKAGNEAVGAWARMGAYSSAHGDDGFISSDVALLIAGKRKVIDALVGAVVKPEGVGFLEPVDGGFKIHDFHVYNPTAAEVAAERKRVSEQRRDAGKASAAARAAQRNHNAPLNGKGNDAGNGR